MKKLILTAVFISFGLLSITLAEGKGQDPKQAKIKELQTVITYLTKQRAIYLENAKQTLRTFDAQIQDAQEQIIKLTPKQNGKNDEKGKEKTKIGP